MEVLVCICVRGRDGFVCGSTGMHFFIRVGERDFFVQVTVCICMIAGERERISLCK